MQVFIHKVLQLQNELEGKRACQKPLKGNGLRIRFPNHWILLSLNARQANLDQDRLSHFNKTGVWLPRKIATIKDLALSQISMHPANIFPLTKSIMTLSSLGYRIFRMFSLKDRFTLPALRMDIASSVAHQASQVELEFLMFLKETQYPDLIFGYGQKHQPMFSSHGKKFFVDGWDPVTGTIIEFAGCSVHGCYICFPPHLENRFGMTNQDAYYAFQIRLEILGKLEGVRKVVVKWEHEWVKEKATNARLRETVNDLDLSAAQAPINPRNCFRGGKSKEIEMLKNYLPSSLIIGICGPSSILMSRDSIAERLSHITAKPVAPKTVTAVAVDVNR